MFTRVGSGCSTCNCHALNHAGVLLHPAWAGKAAKRRYQVAGGGKVGLRNLPGALADIQLSDEQTDAAVHAQEKATAGTGEPSGNAGAGSSRQAAAAGVYNGMGRKLRFQYMHGPCRPINNPRPACLHMCCVQVWE